MLRDWVATNAVEKIAHYRGIGQRRGSAPTLNAAQCAEIMQWAESEHDGALVPFIVLCLFAGILPDFYVGEISKLESKHVRLDPGVITIEPEVSKVRMKRTVAIQPNLAAWLRAYPLEQFPIWPCGFKRLRLEFRKKFPQPMHPECGLPIARKYCFAIHLHARDRLGRFKVGEGPDVYANHPGPPPA